MSVSSVSRTGCKCVQLLLGLKNYFVKVLNYKGFIVFILQINRIIVTTVNFTPVILYELLSKSFIIF